MFKITLPVANFAQGCAYINRIEGQVLLAKAVDERTEYCTYTGRTNCVEVHVTSADRLLEVTTQLVEEEYII